MAKTNYYGSGAIMSAGFDLNSPAPLDYKTTVVSWEPHTETVTVNNETLEVLVYDIDIIPLTAVRVGMIVSDQTEGIAKILKSIPDGITLAHECVWEEVGGTQILSDWNQSDNTSLDYIKNKPTLSTVATSGSYVDLTNKPLSSIDVSQAVSPSTGSNPEKTTTTITLDGTSTTIEVYTRIDSALSSSSKNPVANNVIYNAISNKVDGEDFANLEKIALTTNGILTGEVLSPVLSISDGNYYPTVSDNGNRWKMSKADSATYFKIYDVSNYSTIHLKAVSRAGHILTNSSPSEFSERVHGNSNTNWYEYPEEGGTPAGTNSELADALPKTGWTAYDKDLTTNGKSYLIVYEVNAAQAIEVIYGGGYSPIYTGMFINNGEGSTPADPYATVSQIPAAQVNSDWNASSGVALILNKPNLAAVATSGSYTDLINTPSVTVLQVLDVLNDDESDSD